MAVCMELGNASLCDIVGGGVTSTVVEVLE